MKLKIEISHGGKKYDSIEKALNAAMESGVKELINEKLVPLESEILAAGGYVRVTGSGSKMKLEFLNMPDELAERCMSKFS